MTPVESTIVSVAIAGQVYTLRAHATPEYTKECAHYLDAIISEIRRQAGSALEMERIAILAGLALTDQLFQARAEMTRLQSGTLEPLARLTDEIERRLASSDLASPS